MSLKPSEFVAARSAFTPYPPRDDDGWIIANSATGYALLVGLTRMSRAGTQFPKQRFEARWAAEQQREPEAWFYCQQFRRPVGRGLAPS